MRDLALKILQEETDSFETQSRLRDDVLDAMVRLIEETKQCNIADVVGRSEQLVCEICGEVEVEEQGDWCDKCLGI